MTYSKLLMYISFVWVASEIALGFVARSGAEASHRDRSSLRVLWISISVSIFIGMFVSHLPIGQMPFDARTLFYAGVALIAIGLMIRWTAILTLRRYFTVDVAIRSDHVVVQRGLYRLLRHPSYAGALLSFVGLGLATGNWLTLAIIVIGSFAGFAYRIRVEEDALRDGLGAAYEEYARHTKRLIPGVY